MPRRIIATTIAAAAALLTAAAPALATAKPAATTVKLDTWETPDQAATWEQQDWHQTLAACQAYNLKGFPPLVCGNSAVGGTRMRPGRTYTMTVTGLVGLRNTWANTTCGKPEQLPDGTLAGTDAQFEFANEDDPSTCYLGTGPVAWRAFMISLDAGATWKHPVADGKLKAPTADHAYTFTIKAPGKAGGLGRKPLFKWFDVRTPDNHGSLTIVYRQKAAKKKSGH